MKLIERTFYLDKLKDVMGTPDIKVITGVRRSGKSKLLEAFMEYVRQTDKNANIMHVNYSLSEYDTTARVSQAERICGAGISGGKDELCLH
jgi:predicted AAA+ superfamily ATPase